MATTSTLLTDKKTYIQDVSKQLVHKFGKKKFYSPAQVKYACTRSKYDIDWHCWAMCVFTAPTEFNAYHKAIGEVCDYEAMRSEMAETLTGGVDDSWFDFDLSWLDWPEFELPSVTDIFD